MTICQVPGCDEHFACRLRAKGVNIGPAATPSRPYRNDHLRTITPPRPDLAKVVYDERPNGTKMPILNPDGSPVRVKQAREQASKLRELRQMQQAGRP